MKSLSQSLIVLTTSILVTGCMCMMPMGNMDMGRKDDMGKNGMEKSRMPHRMAGMIAPKEGSDLSMNSTRFLTAQESARICYG